MPLAMILVALILCQSRPATAATPGAEYSGVADLRPAFAARLQNFLNATDAVKTAVSAEGPDLTILRIVRRGAFRPQFRSLIRSFMSDVNSLGFKSLMLYTTGTVCQQVFIAVGTDAAF
jgi:hypothetical protein